MKVNHTFNKTISALGLFCIAASANAEVGFNKSPNPEEGAHINVGVTSASEGRHPSPGGEPGISYSEFHSNNFVSFAGLQRMVPPNTDGVTKITAVPTSHRNMGAFNFAKVADAEIYYGEWATSSDFSGASHMVYYAGKDVTTNMPTTGTATYSVKALNQYDSGAQLTGSLTADFEAKKLTGDITNSDYNYTLNTVIVDSTFNGSVSISTNDELAGTAKGHFFGDEAASLAGIVDFASDTDVGKKMAFAGSK